MENMENKEKSSFSYTYSAKEQAEIKRIREKYRAQTEEEDKMERLRRLDASVTGTAQAVAIALGVVGTLTLGLGMSFCMTELGALFAPHGWLAMAVGVLLGVVGGGMAAAAYPVYSMVVARRRAKLAPEILRLSDELMK